MGLLAGALFLTSVVLSTSNGVAAVEYTVTNTAAGTPGGVRFANEIGVEYSKQVLESATSFIWRTFQQSSPSSRKGVTAVSLVVESIGGVAYTSGNVIHLSANYVNGYGSGLRQEITGVLYHEMVHVWQWDGNRAAPGGLIEGIADYVRLKAGYAPAHWVKPGEGTKWDQGYDVTAQFLNYCNSLRNGFVAQLNEKMRNGYSDSFFVDLLGKDVNQLWSDYKAKYGSV